MYSKRSLSQLATSSRKPVRFRAKAKHGRGNVKSLSTAINTDWLQSQLVRCSPRQIVSAAEDFKWSYLHSNLLSKLPQDLYSSEYRSKAAINKMLETEAKCRSLNQSGLPRGFGYSVERLNTVVFTAQRIIAELLGPLDMSMFDNARFSGGASTSRRRIHGDPYFKYKCMRGKPVHVTRSAYKYAKAIIDCTPRWHVSADDLMIVPGNRVTTVPKKTEIDRTIALEPDMNMLLQKAVGDYLRDRLRKQSVNLNSQELNQTLAKLGSITGNLATIDLSSASDSISVEIVKQLLPHDWFTLLSDLRSERGTLPDGSTIVWEKFSSMGNGFTFELETLLFYAITKSVITVECKATGDRGLRRFVSNKSLMVYGDDIICHHSFATSVISVLSDFGFETNDDKTFTTGPFRESCGKHYYNGYDVTPFYVRKPIDHPHRVVWLLNKIRSWSYDEHTTVCDSATWPLWRRILKESCPQALRGGKDIDSSGAVCMPGKRRSKLVALNRKIPINEYPALLRWFQNNNTFVDPALTHHPSLDEVMDIGSTDSTKQSMLIVKSPTEYRLKRNLEQWRHIPMYSEEYMD